MINYVPQIYQSALPFFCSNKKEPEFGEYRLTGDVEEAAKSTLHIRDYNVYYDDDTTNELANSLLTKRHTSIELNREMCHTRTPSTMGGETRLR